MNNHLRPVPKTAELPPQAQNFTIKASKMSFHVRNLYTINKHFINNVEWELSQNYKMFFYCNINFIHFLYIRQRDVVTEQYRLSPLLSETKTSYASNMLSGLLSVLNVICILC